MVHKEGRIRKIDSGFEVRVFGLDEKAAKRPRVNCLNQSEDPKDREYSIVFPSKKIYPPGQYNTAIREVLEGKNVLRLGFNGYSTIDEDRSKRWGVTTEAYESACMKLAYDVIRYLQSEFPGIDIRLVNGTSDIGVDRATNKVASKLNLPILGFSCPDFMIYALDDDKPVYVAKNREEYSDLFVRSLDVLVAANGAEMAFKHDMKASLEYFKHFIPVDVVSSISTTGGATAFGPDGKVENAVAAYAHLVHIMSQPFGGLASNSFDSIVDHVEAICKNVCRQKLEPQFAFPLK